MPPYATLGLLDGELAGRNNFMSASEPWQTHKCKASVPVDRIFGVSRPFLTSQTLPAANVNRETRDPRVRVIFPPPNPARPSNSPETTNSFQSKDCPPTGFTQKCFVISLKAAT